MLSLGSGLLAHYAGEVLDLARLWHVTRRDGAVFRFTDHDTDLLIPGDGTYLAAGYHGSAIASRADLAVDNLEVGAVFDAAAITEEDLRAGLWDGAVVRIAECVWSDPALGTRILRTGRLGQVTYDGTAWRAELLGLAQRLAAGVGRLVSPACDALLGDARCGVNLAGFTHAFTVTAVLDRNTFTDSALAQAAGYFAAGLVQWATGANAGAAHEIKRHQAGGVLTLFLPAPYEIAVGDTGSVIAGCDKTLATCDAVFGNVVNFRGFPDVPGNDRIFAPRVAG